MEIRWTIRDPIFYFLFFFIVDVLALILFLVMSRRDLSLTARGFVRACIQVSYMMVMQTFMII